jgi:acyl-CoA synthetase (AMP-forming)/AMP-acid ligase II
METAIRAGNTVHQLIEAAATRYPGSPAVSDGGGCTTYRELATRGRVAAGWLRANGVRPGDRVVLMLAGGRDFAALLYGVLASGAIAVPVHPRTGPLHLRWILRDAEPVLAVGAGRDTGSVPLHDSTGVWAGPQRAADPVPVAPDDIALLMYTSGSTGMPQAVVCPHDRVRFAVTAIGQRLGYRRDDVVYCRVPVSFDYGLYQLLLGAAAGAHVVFRPDLPDATMLRMVKATGATVLPVVPTLAAILCQLAAHRPAPTTVRLLTSTGAALVVARASGLRAAFPGASIVPMYGMTECKRITIAEPDEDLRHPGTVGRALDGTTVLVVDDNGDSVPPGVVGEIWVRGPHVMAGYWRAEQATGQRFAGLDGADRTLRTGDYGHLDDAGRLYFAGRRDDIFKRMSVRMSTQEVEAAILDVPGVTAAAVRPPGPDGELVAWVVGDVAAEDVRAGVATRVGRARVPDRCVLLDALPTTVNGKVDRGALEP